MTSSSGSPCGVLSRSLFAHGALLASRKVRVMILGIRILFFGIPWRLGCRALQCKFCSKPLPADSHANTRYCLDKDCRSDAYRNRRGSSRGRRSNQQDAGPELGTNEQTLSRSLRFSGPPATSRSGGPPSRERPRRIAIERQVLMQAPKEARGYSLDWPRQGQGTPNGASPNRPSGTEEIKIWLLDPFERPDGVRLEEDQYYQIRWFDKKGQKLTGCATAWLHYFDGIPDAPVREDELIDRLLDNHRALKKECKKLRARDKKSRMKSTKKKSRWKERIQELKDELKEQGDQFHWKELVFGAGAILAWEHIPRERLLALLTENAPAIWAQIRAMRDSDKAKQEKPMAAESPAEATQESSTPDASMKPPDPVPSPAAQNVPTPQNSPPSSSTPAAQQAPNQTAPPRSPCTREATEMLREALAKLESLPQPAKKLEAPSRAILEASLDLVVKAPAGALAGAVAVARWLGGLPTTEADLHALRATPTARLRKELQGALLHLASSRECAFVPPRDAENGMWLDAGWAFNAVCYLGTGLCAAYAGKEGLGFPVPESQQISMLEHLWEHYGEAWPELGSPAGRIGMLRSMLADLQGWAAELNQLSGKIRATQILARAAREAIGMLQSALTQLETPQPASAETSGRSEPAGAPLPTEEPKPAGVAPGPLATAARPAEPQAPIETGRPPTLLRSGLQLELSLGPPQVGPDQDPAEAQSAAA